MIIYKKLNPIKALSFDLDDTLYDNHPYIRRAQQKLNNLLAQKYPQVSRLSESDWYAIRQGLIEKTPGLISDVSKLRYQTLYLAFQSVGFTALKCEAASQECYAYFYEARSDFKVEQDIIEVMKSLSRLLPVVAITNGNVNCENIGLNDVFQHILRPSITTPAKPHRALFDQMAKQLDIKPQHILHIGDNLSNDVKGAIDADFMSAWYAIDRHMNLNKENVSLLPHIQLHKLDELLQLVVKQNT